MMKQLKKKREMTTLTIDRLILINIFLFLVIGCSNEKFSAELWNTKVDGSFTERKKILEDLQQNYLNKMSKKKDVIKLLGHPTNLHHKENNKIYYEIESFPKYSIDPDWTKYLVFEIGIDSTILNIAIERN